MSEKGVKLDHILKSLMLIATATGCHDCLLMALSFIYRKPITPSLFYSLCRHPFKSDSTASGHSTYTYLTVSTLRNKQHHFVCILLPTHVFNLVPILSVLFPSSLPQPSVAVWCRLDGPLLGTRVVDLFGRDCLEIKVISLLVCLHSWLLPTAASGSQSCGRSLHTHS